MRDFSSIESSYWCLRTSINPEEDLRPLNFEKERERYLSSTRKQGSPEAPFFCYRKPDCRRHLRDIDSLIDSVSDVDHELQTKYMELTSSLKSWMVHFSEKENAFGAWLYSQFGKPDLDVVEAAIGQLKIIDDGDQEKDNEKLDPIDYFRCVLAGYRYDSWKFVTTSMPAKIRISSTEKTIYVDQNAIFSKLALDRLAKHEIGTHVLRHENGSLSNILLLRYGFPNYLETEEGLAIYSEESTGLLSNQDMRKY